MNIMDKIIGLRELREHVAKYAAQVARGQSFIVVKQSKPLFRITPLEEVDPVEDAKGYKTIIDFTKIRKGGVPFKEILSAIKSMDGQSKKVSSKTKR